MFVFSHNSVYNEEKYIGRCLQSLIVQTMSNYEVIIIDDGSDDHSIEICKKLRINFVVVVLYLMLKIEE